MWASASFCDGPGWGKKGRDRAEARKEILSATLHLLKIPDLFCFLCFEKSAQSSRLSDWMLAECRGPGSLSNVDWLPDSSLRPLIGSRRLLRLSLPWGLSNAEVCNAHAWRRGPRSEGMRGPEPGIRASVLLPRPPPGVGGPRSVLSPHRCRTQGTVRYVSFLFCRAGPFCDNQSSWYKIFRMLIELLTSKMLSLGYLL